MYANCCYKPKVEHNPYADWPDGGGEGVKEASAPPLPDYSAINISEIADPMGGGDSVVVVYKDTSADESDGNIPDMLSPSEIGEIV